MQCYQSSTLSGGRKVLYQKSSMSYEKEYSVKLAHFSKADWRWLGLQKRSGSDKVGTSASQPCPAMQGLEQSSLVPELTLVLPSNMTVPEQTTQWTSTGSPLTLRTLDVAVKI